MSRVLVIGCKDGDEVELKNCRRIWYWNGAASLSELALSGVKRDECTPD